jgi:nucleotide-binding universal stress UspA family protein
MTNLIVPPAGTDTNANATAGSLLTSKPDNPVRRGPVLLAIHGNESTAATITFARRLAQRLDTRVEVLTVFEPTRLYGSELGIGLASVPLPYEDVAPVQEELVRRKLREAYGNADWRLTSRYGQPGREIARFAEEVNATMIIVGASPHRTLRHEVSGVRALQVLRRAPCPVLSVAAEAASLPRTVVAAVDFSPASIRAAEAALLALSDGGTCILAHVPPPVSFSRPIADRDGALFGVDLGDAFERLRTELRPFVPPDATLETRQLEGSVATELLELASAVNADLVTVGVHSRNVVERFFVGSVATTLIHGASCSVLASPEPSATETVRLALRLTDSAVSEKPTDWADVLRAASARYAGRRVTLEEDDPGIGSQVQASGFVLNGIDYDAVTKRVDVMLGRGSGPGDHLARMIEGADAIGITAAPDGRDQAIEITHGKGRTVVYFEG